MSPSYTLVFEDSDQTTRVYFDPDDDETPITVDVYGERHWLTREDALGVAHGIEAALGAVPRVAASDISFNEALMRLAVLHGKTVSFSYAKGNGVNIERRRLSPGDVKEVAGHMTFTGYDPDRDEPRAYRTDRIKGEVTIG